ncbi:MAG: carboxypeptidase regulatory-like domain-containing protein [Bryobacteraceae bacterium]
MAFMFAGLSLIGQVDKTFLSGTVKDSTGAVLQAVRIGIRSNANGLRREMLTAETGAYQVMGLPPGVYEVVISKEGFQKLTFEKVPLAVGQGRTLDVVLQPDTVASSIEVNAMATPLEQNNAEIGSVIGETQLKNMPLNGRTWASLMAFAPGAVNTDDGTQNSIRFFGRARDENNWTFDGVDATGIKDPRQEGGLRLVISMDSIAEFKVNSAMYGAESGTGAGGQVNLVSKTGSNQFHGGAFEYLRNSAFDARRPFDPTEIPPFRLNQYGANFGGRIVKDRTFFFANYEGIRQVLSQSNINGLVPSAAFRAQASAQSPAVKPLMDAYPLGNGGSVNANTDRFIGTFKNVVNEDSGLLRVDHRVSDRTSLFFRFNTTDGFLNENRSPLLEARNSNIRPTNATFQVQRVFAPNVINETKFGVNRSALTRVVEGRALQGIEIPGFTTTQNSGYEIEKPTSYSLVNALSWVAGRHTLKIGSEARRIHLNVGDGIDFDVRYSSLANVGLNRLDRFRYNSELPTMGVRRTFLIGYLQDDYKLSQRLTLNMGVRYENFSVPKEVNGRGRVMDLQRCGGFCPDGAEWYYPDNNNFAPRFSLAWSPEALRGKTVIRTGYGIYYGTGQNDDVNAAIDSYAERFQLNAVDMPNNGLTYPIDGFLAQAKSTGASPRLVQRDRRDLYVQQWTMSIQHELPKQFIGQAAYVGNKGTKLFTRNRLNTIDPVTGVRPYPAFNDFDTKDNYGNSSFHGLQASLARSFVKGWQFQGQYMWGHVIDDSSGSGEGQEPQNVFCRACERGNADFDIRQTATLNSVWQLPILRNNRAFGGWTMSGIYTVRTGRPLYITIDRSSAAVPDGNTRRQRPDVVPGVNWLPDVQTPSRFLNPAAFRAPANKTWGNLGRNSLYGPGLWQFDMALNKRTVLKDDMALEFRFEAFNLFNRAQFGQPASNLSSPNFGIIQTTANDKAVGTGTSRQLQFMLRLNF